MSWCRSLLQISSLFLFLIQYASHVVADDNTAPPLPGWYSDEIPAGGSTQEPGLLLPNGPVTLSAPAIAEIDGNTSNGKEVAVGGADGYLHVYKSDGSLLWSSALPITQCKGSKINKLLSSPAVGELFGDGMPYVVVGYGGIGKPCTGGVRAFRGSDGAVRWTFSTEQFARREKFYSFSYSVFSSPALADSDGDGKMEIAFGSFDRNVYLLNSNGKPRWYYNAADTVWSSPAFVNVDSDSNLELVFGTDISQNLKINPPTPNGGYLYAFETNARRPLKIPFRTSQIWRTEFDQVLFSSPVVADVLASNSGPEIIIGSGCFFPQGSTQKRGRWIKVIRPSDGQVLKTLPTQACLSSTVAVGDIDNDGVNEIIATVNGDRQVGGDGYSRVVAWKADGDAPLWEATPNPNDSYGGNFMSPVVADLDGNGSLEVILASSGRIHVFNGSDGSPLTCQGRNCESGGSLILSTGKSLKTTPAIGDLNNDGALEVVIGGANRVGGRGRLFSWTSFADLLGSPSGSHAPYTAPWPNFRGAGFNGNFELQ